MAERLFHDALTLFQEGRYDQSLIELRRAEDAFRKLDAQGHPFNHLQPNGVSGLANALALAGRCHQRLGNTQRAIACYEESFINSKFESKKPFEAFVADLRTDMTACYARELENLDERTRLGIMGQDIRVDTACRFPFSLTKESVILARLYELAPECYPHLRDFVVRAAEEDAALRRSDKKSDESRMQKARFYIWLGFGSLFAAYCLLAVKVLFLK